MWAWPRPACATGRGLGIERPLLLAPAALVIMRDSKAGVERRTDWARQAEAGTDRALSKEAGLTRIAHTYRAPTESQALL